MIILVSGSCGFIGIHLCQKLLELGHEVIGIDNFNDYYDPKMKYDRYSFKFIFGSWFVIR